MTLAFVLGTRPELIKTAPVIHEVARRGAHFAIIHTGQHYTEALDRVFFDELGLPAPRFQLGVGSLPAATQLARIIRGVAGALEEIRPRFVVVQGDTNSVLGAALAAHKLGIAVAHLEAGLRSDDWSMPEEGNRVLAGRVAAVHFCPTDTQRARLAAEGITRGVYVVGNTIVDAALMFAARARGQSSLLPRLGIADRPFAVLTMHRPSNVDDDARLRALLTALAHVAERRGLRIFFPVHPRTAERIDRSSDLRALVDRAPFVSTGPVGYLDMLRALEASTIAVTDSGGVQEEACILRVPCVTLRANTERPETVDVGANRLCYHATADSIDAAVQAMLDRPRDWPNPFGDGRTAERVADVLLDPTTRVLPSGMQ